MKHWCGVSCAGSISGKDPPASAGDIRVVALIPGWGRAPGEGDGKHSSIHAWRIPFTEEPDRL